MLRFSVMSADSDTKHVRAKYVLSKKYGIAPEAAHDRLEACAPGVVSGAGTVGPRKKSSAQPSRQ